MDTVVYCDSAYNKSIGMIGWSYIAYSTLPNCDAAWLRYGCEKYDDRKYNIGNGIILYAAIIAALNALYTADAESTVVLYTDSKILRELSEKGFLKKRFYDDSILDKYLDVLQKRYVDVIYYPGNKHKFSRICDRYARLACGLRSKDLNRVPRSGVKVLNRSPLIKHGLIII